MVGLFSAFSLVALTCEEGLQRECSVLRPLQRAFNMLIPQACFVYVGIAFCPGRSTVKSEGPTFTSLKAFMKPPRWYFMFVLLDFLCSVLKFCSKRYGLPFRSVPLPSDKDRQVCLICGDLMQRQKVIGSPLV